MNISYKHIRHLIHSERSLSKWIGYIGLGIGMVILLLAVQMFVNIQKLIREEVPQKSGNYDYVSISKTITNENMGKDNRFSRADLELLKDQPEISGVAPLYSNQFSARATAGDVLPFSTDLFLESLDKNFLDTLPAGFDWQPGQKDVPIIFSSDFLEMYNVFAPSQGLPQLSPKTISSVNIFLECSGPVSSQSFRASIVGLSDRVNSILVPESFLKWGNIQFTGDSSSMISRVYIKTVDANNPALIQFLDNHHYHINKDKIRFGRIKGILQNTIGVIGGFGILVVVLALILFGFYLQLMIAKSKENVKLLLMLGYSPKWLSQSFTKNFLPVYFGIIIVSIILVSIAQFLFSRLGFAQPATSPYVHLTVWLTAIVMLLLTVFVNIRMVKKEITKLSEEN